MKFSTTHYHCHNRIDFETFFFEPKTKKNTPNVHKDLNIIDENSDDFIVETEQYNTIIIIIHINNGL